MQCEVSHGSCTDTYKGVVLEVLVRFHKFLEDCGADTLWGSQSVLVQMLCEVPKSSGVLWQQSFILQTVWPH